MAMKLHEIHPSLVHLPLGLFPFSLGADLVGRISGDDHFHDLGRATLLGATAGAWAAGAAGLLAQQKVDGDDHAFDMLITHRTLNIVGTVALTGLAWWRRRHAPAGVTYLLGGLATLGGMVYSAYIGGKMVYDHGMGVRPAGGVQKDVPELTRGEAGRAAKQAVTETAAGVRLTAEETVEGKVAPSFGDLGRN